jgi:hypothetical protein
VDVARVQGNRLRAPPARALPVQVCGPALRRDRRRGNEPLGFPAPGAR